MPHVVDRGTSKKPNRAKSLVSDIRRDLKHALQDAGYSLLELPALVKDSPRRPIKVYHRDRSVICSITWSTTFAPLADPTNNVDDISLSTDTPLTRTVLDTIKARLKEDRGPYSVFHKPIRKLGDQIVIRVSRQVLMIDIY